MADYENSDYLVVYDTVKDRERESTNETPMNILFDDPVTLWRMMQAVYCGIDFRATFGTEARALTFIEFYSAIKICNCRWMIFEPHPSAPVRRRNS